MKLLPLFFVAFLFSIDVSADDRLNWQPLDVSEISQSELDADETGENVDSADLEKSDGRYLTLLEKFRRNMAKRQKKKNREVKAVTKETVYSAIQEMIESSYPGGVEAMMEQREQLEDDVYNLIMKLPKYAYQYIGPFLFDMPYVSERILNIPGIKETKGKFPTRIADQMKDYVKKHGKYMSSHLYIYLMPDAWAFPVREKANFKGYSKIVTIDENTKPDDLFYIYNPSLLKKFKTLPPDDYRSGKALERKFRPQTSAAAVTEKSPLTEGDVQAALDSFASIGKAFGDDRFDDFHSALRDMSLTDNNLMEELKNPMKTLADKIKRLPEAQKFEQAVAKNGFTTDSWAITVDKIIKARRVATMSPAVAVNLSVWRKLKKPPKSFDVLSPRDKKIAWDSIMLFAAMYESTNENLLAVKNYGDKIRQIFATQDMMVLEAPVYGVY